MGKLKELKHNWKPCPFCGSDKVKPMDGPIAKWVACTICYAVGPRDRWNDRPEPT